MGEIDPVTHLARMIANHGSKPEAYSAMFWAHFDETIVNEADQKTGKSRPVEMIVGGCIAAQDQWEKFTAKWKEALAIEGIDTFHAKDFYLFQHKFKWFTPDGERDWKRHGEMRDRLTDIILEHVDEIIAFNSQIPVVSGKVRPSYEDAAMRAIYDFTKPAIGRDSLYLVFARHPEMSPWSILRNFENIDFEKRLAGCGIFYPGDVPPLQASDFVLSTINKRWGGLETKSFQRLKEGCLKRNIPFHQQIASTLNVQARPCRSV